MQIKLKKFSASGNTFYLLDNRKSDFSGSLAKLIQDRCRPKNEQAVDGLLVLEGSKRAAVRMRIFNPDGSEAEMCANGARVVAFYLKPPRAEGISIETISGIIQAQTQASLVKVGLTTPSDIKLNMALEVNDRQIRVSFINTGVPHVIVFVNALSRIDVDYTGRVIRNDAKFKPQGTNVNFVEITSFNTLKLRTYERGVERETLACGTGIVASALLSFRLSFIRSKKIKVISASREILNVEFEYENGRFNNVWLEGKVYEIR